MYEPPYSGVKLKGEPVPVRFVLGPVTLQLKVYPAALTAVLGSVAEPVSVIAVPAGSVAGNPVNEAVGATLLTTIVCAGETPTLPLASVVARLIA